MANRFGVLFRTPYACFFMSILILADICGFLSASSQDPISKMSPSLRSSSEKGENQEVPVTVFIEKESKSRLPINQLREVEVVGIRMLRGVAAIRDVRALASLPEVTAIEGVSTAPPPEWPDFHLNEAGSKGVSREEFLKALQNAPPHDRSQMKAPIQPGQSNHKSWFGNDLLGVQEAWDRGIDGAGVKIAIIDTGIDFAHPDLHGTQARVEDPNSPYFGWPICFDSKSMARLFLNQTFSGTWYSDTSTDPMVTVHGSTSTAFFDILNNGVPETHEFTFLTESVSGHYHFGLHPDTTLALDVLNGMTPAVLVVDHPDTANRGPGYNTVYVDLDADFDFTDEKPCYRGNEISFRDVWNSQVGAQGTDGYPDVSGGMVYFIADGIHPVPVSDWLYGAAPPAKGSLVAFTLDDPRLLGEHGTGVASCAVGQGIINGNPPPIKPPYSGPGDGMVQGPARGARIIAMGPGLSGFETDFQLVCALGYDGLPNTGDEPNIVNQSYVYYAEAEGWDFYSRFIDWLNRTIAPETAWVKGVGNSGPGYGTVFPQIAFNTIKVGACTTFDTGNVFDSIQSMTQVLSGEIASFSSLGLLSDGQQGVNLVANGSSVSGDRPLNAVHDGWKAWSSFSGTSLAGPGACAVAALVFQAYKQSHGTWPGPHTVRKILMNSASDLHYDVFRQGAGRIHAGRAVALASGQEGILVEPPLLIAGNYRGQNHPAYSTIAYPGDAHQHSFQVANTASTPVSLQIKDSQLKEFAHTDFTIDTVASPLEAYDARQPHYLHLLQGHGVNTIPPGTDHMIIEAIFPFEDFDTDFVPGDPGTLKPPAENRYILLAYDWTDWDRDGKLVDDSLGAVPGLVEANEIDTGEYMRFDAGFVKGTTLKMSIAKPLSKMHDGIWIGIQHYKGPPEGYASRIRVRVRFFQETDCPWLSTSISTLMIPGDSTATLDATVQLPPDQPYGSHSAKILLTPAHAKDIGGPAELTVIPVSVNVAADLATGKVTISGATGNGEPYDRFALHGGCAWDDRRGLGDSRIFFVDAQNPPEGSYLLTRTSWSDPPPSDIDTIILGPVKDGFSNPDSSYYHPDFDLGTLTPIGGARLVFEKNRLFHTSSGGPLDYVIAPLRDGLHGLILQNVLHSGKRFALPFTLECGRLTVQPHPLGFLTATPQLEETVTITSTLAVPDFSVSAYGPSQPSVLAEDKEQAPGDFWWWSVPVSNCAYMRTDLVLTEGIAELAVFRDGADGTPPDGYYTPEEVVMYGHSSGLESRIEIPFPPDGLYFIVVYTNLLSDQPAVYSLANHLVQGQNVSINFSSPGALQADTPLPVQIQASFNKPQNYDILLYMGPSSAPNSIPLLIPATSFLPGDADFSGSVDAGDMMLLSEKWLSTSGIPPSLDFDRNGKINAHDLVDFLGLAK